MNFKLKAFLVISTFFLLTIPCYEGNTQTAIITTKLIESLPKSSFAGNIFGPLRLMFFEQGRMGILKPAMEGIFTNELPFGEVISLYPMVASKIFLMGSKSKLDYSLIKFSETQPEVGTNELNRMMHHFSVYQKKSLTSSQWQFSSQILNPMVNQSEFLADILKGSIEDISVIDLQKDTARFLLYIQALLKSSLGSIHWMTLKVSELGQKGGIDLIAGTLAYLKELERFQINNPDSSRILAKKILEMTEVFETDSPVVNNFEVIAGEVTNDVLQAFGYMYVNAEKLAPQGEVDSYRDALVKAVPRLARILDRFFVIEKERSDLMKEEPEVFLDRIAMSLKLTPPRYIIYTPNDDEGKAEYIKAQLGW